MLLIVFDIEALVDVWDWLKMSSMRNSDSMISHAKHLGTFLGSMPIKLISQNFKTWHRKLRGCDVIDQQQIRILGFTVEICGLFTSFIFQKILNMLTQKSISLLVICRQSFRRNLVSC